MLLHTYCPRISSHADIFYIPVVPKADPGFYWIQGLQVLMAHFSGILLPETAPRCSDSALPAHDVLPTENCALLAIGGALLSVEASLRPVIAPALSTASLLLEMQLLLVERAQSLVGRLELLRPDWYFGGKINLGSEDTGAPTPQKWHIPLGTDCQACSFPSLGPATG